MSLHFGFPSNYSFIHANFYRTFKPSSPRCLRSRAPDSGLQQLPTVLLAAVQSIVLPDPASMCSKSCWLRNCLATKRFKDILRRELKSRLLRKPRRPLNSKVKSSTMPTRLWILTATSRWSTSVLRPKRLLKLYCHWARRKIKPKRILWWGSWRHSCH